MRLRIELLALAILVSMPVAHAAKLYKWVDKDGRVTYHDAPPPAGAGYRAEEKALGPRDETRGTASGDKVPVILYSAPKCNSCDLARSYLKTRGVAFTEKNVDGDRKLQDELIKQAGGLSVPTIVVGTKVMRGYLESILEGELDDAGYPKPESQETSKTSQ